MARLHTHYDDLKVAHDAPPEVIKAAYRALAQRYHPDVNSSAEAGRVMKAINQAWAVLGDSDARRRYDEWIEEQFIAEALEEAGAQTRDSRNQWSHDTTSADNFHQFEARSRQGQPNFLVKLNAWLGTPKGKTVMMLSVVGVVVFGFSLLTIISPSSSKTSSSLTSYQPALPHKNPEQTFRELPSTVRLDPAPTPVLPVQPTIDRWSPNGKPWPKTAGYLAGMPQRASGGLSRLTVDNTNGGSDVHIKLCAFGAVRCGGLRNVFVPQGASFTINNIAPGIYDLRYRDLSSGRIAKSEQILLRQIEEDARTRYSVFTITLYRVRGGNTNFTTVPEEQF